jgi:hypothetical protein
MEPYLTATNLHSKSQGVVRSFSWLSIRILIHRDPYPSIGKSSDRNHQDNRIELYLTATNVQSKSQVRWCLNIFTTPLWQWGFWQCLPFSRTTLRGKHCRHPIAVMGVVDTFRQYPSRHHPTYTVSKILVMLGVR